VTDAGRDRLVALGGAAAAVAVAFAVGAEPDPVPWRTILAVLVALAGTAPWWVAGRWGIVPAFGLGLAGFLAVVALLGPIPVALSRLVGRPLRPLLEVAGVLS
jgi:hypothetical protein